MMNEREVSSCTGTRYLGHANIPGTVNVPVTTSRTTKPSSAINAFISNNDSVGDLAAWVVLRYSKTQKIC